MVRSIAALVKPELVRWARKSAGLDLRTAARRIGQPEERIRAWEAGEEAPTIAQLRKSAQVYKRPLAVFYLPEVPKDFAPLRDLRRLPADVPAQYSPELLYLMRSVLARQEWAIEMRREVKLTRVRFVSSADIDESIPAVAKRIRKMLNISQDEQLRYRDTDAALRRWVAQVERLGVFVFQSSDVALAEMRGFALPHPIAPVVLINSKDARSARVFTLLHEFVHIVVGSEGVSNLVLPNRPRTLEQKTEVFCNAVAAEVLVPELALRSAMKAAGTWQNRIDEVIRELSRDFSVSREVIARRLTDLGFTSRTFYERKREELTDEFERYTKSRRGKEFRVPYARIILRNNGRAFARLVLSAHGDSLITGRDVSSLLNMKLKHYDRVTADVFRQRIAGGADE
ncbi:MAG: ImmA/IrrE family metallo-endopeptidase [Phycisphaerales bacterium]|nr:MAG: ImmA/IrrE family metallo-endopeptidase [Phycisphaerales bacterium]